MNASDLCTLVISRTGITTPEGNAKGEGAITHTFKVDLTALTWAQVAELAARSAVITRQATLRKQLAKNPGKYPAGKPIRILVGVAGPREKVDPVQSFAAIVAAMTPSFRRAFLAEMAKDPNATFEDLKDRAAEVLEVMRDARDEDEDADVMQA